jgi:hypothetical protein
MKTDGKECSLARNSSSSPGVVDELLAVVEAHLGEGTAQRFLARFKMTEYFDELQKPMLRGAGEWSPATLDDADCDQISAVRIENPSLRPVDAVLTVEFPRTNAEDVFSRFVMNTSHANPLADFRNFPERYAPILLGPRYFLFHGDGHCFALSNLLASLLARASEAEFGVRYTSTKDRSFIHTFVTADGDGQTTIFDADQKAIFGEGDTGAPYGMIYQLLGLAGALTFEKANKRGWQWMFAEQTRRYFAESYADQATAPRIYRRQPTPEAISDLFAQAIVDHVEAVSLDVDDYGWKAPFRDACSGEALLSHVDRPVRLVLPPGGRIAIGIDAEALPIESHVLPLIFFGRVPATISAELSSAGTVAFELPERPWLICLSSEVKRIMINGHAVDTHESGEFAVVGAHDLDGIMGEPGVSGTAPLVVSGPAGATVRVVLPFNGLAFNSGSIRIRCDANAWIAGPRPVADYAARRAS